MLHPFETLTPDVVLNALEATGLLLDGRLMTLSSYENRVYMAHTDDGNAVVAKFYRPERWSDAQIQEEHDFAAELAAAEIPLAAPIASNGQTLHHAHGFRYSVSPRKGGRRPELDDLDTLEWIGRFLARIHTVGAAKPFAVRPALNVASFGTEPYEWLLQHEMVAPEVRTAWRAAYQEAISLVAACADNTLAGAVPSTESALQNSSAASELLNPSAENAQSNPQTESNGPPAIQTIRLHGDCHPGNILWTPEGSTTQAPGPHFVDLDDARSGPAVQDLWMLLSGDRRQRTLQLSALLDGYEQFRSFDRRELALIEPLRTLRLVHYSAWLARRWDDPAFPAAFPHFGTSAYWHEQLQLLQEQIEMMQEAPLIC